jgi:Family of unknown function (DUF6328)
MALSRAVAARAQLALNETRLLVLGVVILVGFQLRAFLEHGFPLLPPSSRDLRLVSLAAMLATLLLLMVPIGYHQVTQNGAMNRRVQRIAGRAIVLALGPFALALGLDLYTVATRIGGPVLGVLAGALTAAAAVTLWYGWAWAARDDRLAGDRSPPRPAGPLSARVPDPPPIDRGTLHFRISGLLVECRVVIPGAQALLGFQLIAVLMSGFDRLPRIAQEFHLVSLALLTATVMLLMAPASYHRIVARGADQVRVWRFGRTMLLAAMACLATGLAIQWAIVFDRVTGSGAWAIASAAVLCLAFLVLWFGWPEYLRRRGT